MTAAFIFLFVCGFVSLYGICILDNFKERLALSIFSGILLSASFCLLTAYAWANGDLVHFLDRKNYYECQYVPNTESEKYEAYYEIKTLNKVLEDHKYMDEAEGLSPIYTDWMPEIDIHKEP